MRSSLKLWPWMLAAAFVVPAPAAHAQAWTPGKGYGAVTLGAQYTRVMKHLFSVDVGGYVDPTGYVGGPKNQAYFGDIVGETSMLSVDYGLLRRLAVSAEVAYVASRYHGLAPEAAIDDGKFHGKLQDLIVGARYRLPVPEVALTPFATYRTPLTHYSNIGHTAPGLGLDEFTLGLAAGRTLEPAFPQVALQAAYSHDFVSGLDGFSLDRNIYSMDAAYFATRRLTLSGQFSYAESVDGLDWWWMPPTMEDLMDHDVASKVLVRHGNVGASLRLTSLLSLSADYLWTISGANTHDLQGVTFSVSRSISTHARK
jgi:hypothetical protein